MSLIENIHSGVIWSPTALSGCVSPFSRSSVSYNFAQNDLLGARWNRRKAAQCKQAHWKKKSLHHHMLCMNVYFLWTLKWARLYLIDKWEVRAVVEAEKQRISHQAVRLRPELLNMLSLRTCQQRFWHKNLTFVCKLCPLGILNIQFEER